MTLQDLINKWEDRRTFHDKEVQFLESVGIDESDEEKALLRMSSEILDDLKKLEEKE